MALTPKASIGFGRQVDLGTALYRWDKAYFGDRCGLIIYRARHTDLPLHGTEFRPGTEVDVRIRRTTGVYHDGMWQIQPLQSKQDTPQFLWSVAELHSLTLYGDRFCYGVRASKDQGVSISELVSVARGLDFSTNRH
jgi:hypothetical protein